LLEAVPLVTLDLLVPQATMASLEMLAQPGPLEITTLLPLETMEWLSLATLGQQAILLLAVVAVVAVVVVEIPLRPWVTPEQQEMLPHPAVMAVMAARDQYLVPRQRRAELEMLVTRDLLVLPEVVEEQLPEQLVIPATYLSQPPPATADQVLRMVVLAAQEEMAIQEMLPPLVLLLALPAARREMVEMVDQLEAREQMA
jgi:hypothetical protein